MHQLPEMSMEEMIADIRRDIGFLLQAMRVLGKALGVKEEIDRLTYSLEHRYSTDPGVDGE